jgi:hypothetical protein
MNRVVAGISAGLMTLGLLLSDPVVAELRVSPLDPMAQAVVGRGKRISPPRLARLAWDDVIRCTGIVPLGGKDFESIRWVRIPGPGFQWPGLGSQALGVWMSQENQVLIAETRVDDPAVLKHELLHALLQGRAGRGHRHPDFQPHNHCGIYPARD